MGNLINKLKENKSLKILLYCVLGLLFVWGVQLFSHYLNPSYLTNSGEIFGTYYNIQYKSSEDLHKDILKRLEEFDNSLSAFNNQSVISKINHNESDEYDADFEAMFTEAEKIYALSNGAFDPTIAPLVGAWGFGFTQKEQLTKAKVDSLLQFVGLNKCHIENGHFVKDNPAILLDASAIAKGQACDVIAQLLRDKGVENFMVEIGGEIVCQGKNPRGGKWRVGITKPVDDTTAQQQETQAIIETDRLCMATSGNYRQFYYEGEQKRSHTIDPRTGYPVQHALLSATVIAPTCMKADALATACMVLGVDSAVLLLKNAGVENWYLIYEEDSVIKVNESLQLSNTDINNCK